MSNLLLAASHFWVLLVFSSGVGGGLAPYLSLQPGGGFSETALRLTLSLPLLYDRHISEVVLRQHRRQEQRAQR